jgi:hypothetical protein
MLPGPFSSCGWMSPTMTCGSTNCSCVEFPDQSNFRIRIANHAETFEQCCQTPGSRRRLTDGRHSAVTGSRLQRIQIGSSSRDSCRIRHSQNNSSRHGLKRALCSAADDGGVLFRSHG